MFATQSPREAKAEMRKKHRRLQQLILDLEAQLQDSKRPKLFRWLPPSMRERVTREALAKAHNDYRDHINLMRRYHAFGFDLV